MWSLNEWERPQMVETWMHEKFEWMRKNSNDRNLKGWERAHIVFFELVAF